MPGRVYRFFYNAESSEGRIETFFAYSNGKGHHQSCTSTLQKIEEPHFGKIDNDSLISCNIWQYPCCRYFDGYSHAWYKRVKVRICIDNLMITDVILSCYLD